MYQLVERANKTSLFVRDCISTALFDLMEKKDFRKIKITEIIERAGVSRMGFYRNFKSKEDVVEQFIYEKFVETVKEIESKRKLNLQVYNIMETSLEKFKKYSKFMKLFLEQNLEWLMYECYCKAFYALYNRENTSRFREYHNKMFIGQLFNLEIAWLKNGMVETPKELANIYSKILKVQSNIKIESK